MTLIQMYKMTVTFLFRNFILIFIHIFVVVNKIIFIFVLIIHEEKRKFIIPWTVYRMPFLEKKQLPL